MREWKSAGIVELDLSETELDVTEGVVVDGEYHDCSGTYYDGYYAS